MEWVIPRPGGLVCREKPALSIRHSAVSEDKNQPQVPSASLGMATAICANQQHPYHPREELQLVLAAS
jgi:hypothetical protein